MMKWSQGMHNSIIIAVGWGLTPPTIGNRGTFIRCNKFIGTDEFNSKYICWYPKPMNIGYIHWFGLETDEYIGS
jgi:hypothetical protein